MGKQVIKTVLRTHFQNFKEFSFIYPKKLKRMSRNFAQYAAGHDGQLWHFPLWSLFISSPLDPNNAYEMRMKSEYRIRETILMSKFIL